MNETDEKEFLEAKKYFESVKQKYMEDPKKDSFNALVCGESGTGKTYLARTAKKPVHIDSFDPGGTKGLRKWIDSGEIIADTRWEKEDRTKPSVYRLWKEEMKHRGRIGYYSHIGTYWLDSATTWGEAIMNWVLSQASIAGDIPRFTKDYQPQKYQIRNWITKLLAIPCDFVLTAHLKFDADNDAKDLRYRMLTTGDGVAIIPLLFDEIYVSFTKESSDGLSYFLITKNVGKYLGSSRMGGDKFKTYEVPDIKELLKKAGLPAKDKPLLT